MSKVIPLRRPAALPAKRVRNKARARVGFDPGTCFAELSDAEWASIADALDLTVDEADQTRWTDGRSLRWLFDELVAYPINRMDFDNSRPKATKALKDFTGLAERLTGTIDHIRSCSPHTLTELGVDESETAALIELRDTALGKISQLKGRDVINRRSRGEVIDRFLGGVAVLVKQAGVENNLPSRSGHQMADEYPIYRAARCVIQLALTRAATAFARDELRRLNDLAPATLLDRLHRARRKWKDMPLSE